MDYQDKTISCFHEKITKEIDESHLIFPNITHGHILMHSNSTLHSHTGPRLCCPGHRVKTDIPCNRLCDAVVRITSSACFHPSACCFPSARWARRGIVVPFLGRRLRRHLRHRRTHSFGYYTNMVQQIEFIIHTNIQPFPALIFTQGQSYRSKVKVKYLKNYFKLNNLKNNYWISPFFHVKLPMSMEIT